MADAGLPRNQAAFRTFLKEKELSDSTINRILTVGRAAMNRAWKNGEITSVPHIELLSIGEVDPKGRPLEVLVIVALLDNAESEHLFNFILLMIATASRPDAIRDLKFDQLDFENELIHLNTKGRKQTKKYRPTVKMPKSLLGWLEDQEDGYLINYYGEHIKNLKTAWRATRKRAGLDNEVNPYSLRHTMARWMRKEGVSAWEIASQLGHKQRDFSTTEVYAPLIQLI